MSPLPNQPPKARSGVVSGRSPGETSGQLGFVPSTWRRPDPAAARPGGGPGQRRSRPTPKPANAGTGQRRSRATPEPARPGRRETVAVHGRPPPDHPATGAVWGPLTTWLVRDVAGLVLFRSGSGCATSGRGTGAAGGGRSVLNQCWRPSSWARSRAPFGTRPDQRILARYRRRWRARPELGRSVRWPGSLHLMSRDQIRCSIRSHRLP
ncbi:MAG: hypothetical protein QOF30_1969 [Acidimicrobiaceae bacterium]|nr:hypothetical protein [Acidimicrobiaceae bacterium]